jgi:hypothetical protein
LIVARPRPAPAEPVRPEADLTGISDQEIEASIIRMVGELAERAERAATQRERAQRLARLQRLIGSL